MLGPYQESRGWRVIELHASGKRTSTLCETEARALRYKEILEADLVREDHTTETALEAYKRHLADKGTQAHSVAVVGWFVEQFFPISIPLALLSSTRCDRLYEDLRGRVSEKTKRPYAVDTTRKALKHARSFLAWCVKQNWLRENPCAAIEGIGRLRPRGKSLGQAGNELGTMREARAWYAKALELAHAGDDGAVAALMALLLGMRASEIVGSRVAALDDVEAPGDTLWIACAKTPAGRRRLEVPDALRPLLLARADGRPEDAFLLASRSRGESRPHRRTWVIAQVHRICDLAEVQRVTAHSLRGLLATLTAERGTAGHAIAQMLGHADLDTAQTARVHYAQPGAFEAGGRRRGLVVLNGGVQVSRKQAK